MLAMRSSLPVSIMQVTSRPSGPTIATTLRPFSQPHQREEAFKLLQRQADSLPALVDRLQAMMSAIEQQSGVANERQLSQQAAFHDRTEAVYSRLASSVQQSLMEGAAESARAASTALQPVVEATMAGMAHNAASLHAEVMQSLQQQVEGLSTGFQASTRTVAELWSQSLAEQRQCNDALLQDLRATLERFTDTFDQRSAGMVESVSARFDAATRSASAAWAEAVSQQTAAGNEFAVRNQDALAAASATFETHAASLVRVVHESHADLQSTLEAKSQERLEAWAETFGAMTGPLVQRWEQAGEHAASRQQALCDTLARTADTIAAQTQAHARDTIAEISRLVEAASEAPKAAADVIAELRQKLSDSMVRDTAMLEERGRLLATVETLLDAVNHASTEQRTSVDSLISTTADLLDRVGTRFTAHVEAETGKLDAAATRIAAGAIEVASLGDTFGAAVQRFGESNDQLVARLQAIEAALDQSLARSDEQLAYYVAQAREVIDLSVLSQKQIIGELKHLADQRAAVHQFTRFIGCALGAVLAQHQDLGIRDREIAAIRAEGDVITLEAPLRQADNALQEKIEPVSRESGHRGQQEQGHKLREPEKSELERGLGHGHPVIVACNLVELVAEQHDHRHGRKHRHEAGEPVTPVVADL